MGNTTEFMRVVAIIEEEMTFEKDINVSVFETNIRGNINHRICKFGCLGIKPQFFPKF